MLARSPVVAKPAGAGAPYDPGCEPYPLPQGLPGRLATQPGGQEPGAQSIPWLLYTSDAAADMQ